MKLHKVSAAIFAATLAFIFAGCDDSTPQQQQTEHFVTINSELSTIAGDIASLTQNAKIIMTGQLSDNQTTSESSDWTTVRNALKDSDYKIDLDLSQVTGLTILPTRAFYECTNLISVTLPDTVFFIGDQAFENCYSLKSLSISSAVTIIRTQIFLNCTSLKKIEVDPENAKYCSQDGVLFNKDKTSLIQYPPSSPQTSYTMPDTVTSIETGAFEGTSNLKSLRLSNSLTTIERSAFAKCSFKSIIIPNSVTTIKTNAFCESKISSITIPASVTEIENDAFSFCYNLTSITVDSNNTVYTSVDGVLFNKNQTEIIRYPQAKTDTSYTIPSTVTTIVDRAFHNSIYLTSVILPNGTTKILPNAFASCYQLTSITIPSNVDEIGCWAFSTCTSLTSITFEDTDTWYTCEKVQDREAKTNGIQRDVTNPERNAEFFVGLSEKVCYDQYHWYKK